MSTQKERQDAYRSVGACTNCGEDLRGAEKAAGFRRCEVCRVRVRQRECKRGQLRRARCQAWGLCKRCYRSKTVPGMKQCTKCAERDRQRRKATPRAESTRRVERNRAVVALLELRHPKIATSLKRELGL